MKAYDIFFLTTIVLTLLLTSCSKEITIENPENSENPDTKVEKEVVGTTKVEEETGFGAPEFPDLVNFGLDGGALTIHSGKKADKWYFSELILNDSVIILCYLQSLKDRFPDWDFLQNIEVTTDGHERNVVYVKTDWFSLKKIDNKTIDITVEPSEEARQFKILVSNLRDAGMYINVVQKDENN